jgi:tRNA(Phe) wybutosine-synthesizing methylase Tyw3
MANRVCRACGASYDYPTRGALATRVHCEECATLDARTRRALERLNQRVGRLSVEVERLKETKS